MADSRPYLKDLTLDALRECLRAGGLPAYRAEQVAGWIYQRGVEDVREMTDLPAELRERLAADWQMRALDVVRVDTARDGTRKAALRAGDGAVVESVLIPEDRRTTLCLSTQVGCPLACSFCATGAMGFGRNLRTAEIIDQVLRMRELLPEGRRITNLVFMGMGEPLLNLDAVGDAIRLLLDPKAFAFAPRRVTVSTVGLVPRIPELLDALPVNLAVSLHATTDAVRDVLVPINRRFPIASLMECLRGLEGLGRRRPIFFEYTLIRGMNDSPDDAQRLVSLLRGLPAKVNLIPMNGHPASSYQAPDEAVIEDFVAVLARSGLRVTLRRPRGDDIAAACGQLAGGEGIKPGRPFSDARAGG